MSILGLKFLVVVRLFIFSATFRLGREKTVVSDGGNRSN